MILWGQLWSCVTISKIQKPIKVTGLIWFRGLDLNQRPSGYETGQVFETLLFPATMFSGTLSIDIVFQII